MPSASAHGFCMCVLYFSWILSLDVDSQSMRIDCLTILSWLKSLQAVFMKTPNPPKDVYYSISHGNTAVGFTKYKILLFICLKSVAFLFG